MVRSFVLVTVQARSTSDDWSNPLFWIVIAVVLALIIVGGYLLIRRPWSDASGSMSTPSSGAERPEP